MRWMGTNQQNDGELADVAGKIINSVKDSGYPSTSCAE
jgi:hypothetical protein